MRLEVCEFTWPKKMTYVANELPELFEITSSMERKVDPMYACMPWDGNMPIMDATM